VDSDTARAQSVRPNQSVNRRRQAFVMEASIDVVADDAVDGVDELDRPWRGGG
jgi:hypothetical protein